MIQRCRDQKGGLQIRKIFVNFSQQWRIWNEVPKPNASILDATPQTLKFYHSTGIRRPKPRLNPSARLRKREQTRILTRSVRITVSCMQHEHSKEATTSPARLVIQPEKGLRLGAAQPISAMSAISAMPFPKTSWQPPNQKSQRTFWTCSDKSTSAIVRRLLNT